MIHNSHGEKLSDREIRFCTVPSEVSVSAIEGSTVNFSSVKEAKVCSSIGSNQFKYRLYTINSNTDYTQSIQIQIIHNQFKYRLYTINSNTDYTQSIQIQIIHNQFKYRLYTINSNTDYTQSIQIQIIHNHCIVASNMADAARGLVHVLVYDLMCTSLDEDTEKVILNLFQRGTTGSVTIEMINIQHQTGTSDCGLFAFSYCNNFGKWVGSTSADFCAGEDA